MNLSNPAANADHASALSSHEPVAVERIRLQRKHPLAIRWMHWINFPILFTMVWSGRSTLHAGTPGLLLTMADIQAFPRQELITEFKCIKGRSQIVHWAGVRMREKSFFTLRAQPDYAATVA
jgi:hypothetical protein